PVRADAARIHQVLANILGNAIKFTPDGGMVTLRAQHAGNSVRFSVTDTGPGIDEEDRPHLFDRFWQVPSTASMGSGLGLFIARAIVESHDGTIGVESVVGKGTTFAFHLPVASTA